MVATLGTGVLFKACFVTCLFFWSLLDFSDVHSTPPSPCPKHTLTAKPLVLLLKEVQIWGIPESWQNNEGIGWALSLLPSRCPAVSTPCPLFSTMPHSMKCSICNLNQIVTPLEEEFLWVWIWYLFWPQKDSSQPCLFPQFCPKNWPAYSLCWVFIKSVSLPPIKYLSPQPSLPFRVSLSLNFSTQDWGD